MNVEAALDAAHAEAQRAFRAKDVAAYMSRFAPDLEYTQLNGKTIGRRQLARDVVRQFRSVRAVDSSYRRESLEVSGERAVEVVVQDAVAEVGAFLGVVRREWRIRRRGRYLWTDTGDGWQIAHVHVLEETVTGSRVWFRLPW